MSADISFDENKYKIKSHVVLGQPESPKMVRYLISKGIVKSEKQALNILLILMLISISLTIFIIYNNFFKVPYVPPLTIEEEILFKQNMR
jgi:hypothetical protein